MKYSLALLTAAVAFAAAVPHQDGAHHHKHRHAAPLENREASPADPVVVPGPTLVTYIMNGKPISEDEVKKGLANGNLVLADNGSIAEASSVPAPSVAAPKTSSTSAYVAPTTSAAPPPPPPATSSAAPVIAQHVASSSGSSSGGSGVNTPFPDGQLDCSTFPSAYGAVPINHIGLGGWTGVQQGGSGSSLLAGLANILTVTSNTCSGGNCCTEGSYCSYACPAGYQKSQWPTTQGQTGQSVGGILCQGGKLHLTNPGLSSNLCMTGTDKVTVLVKNTLGQNVPVCRTDYPGTESETIPVDVQPGSTSNLTCPDAANYYTWGGKSTSAQYYVNPAGTPAEEGCSWGTAANPWGNFAPMNLGVGYSNGRAWLSIFQNAPTTDAKLQFSVEIVGGDDMSGKCKYHNGQYCGGADGNDCSPTTGCTVSVGSGVVTYVFS